MRPFSFQVLTPQKQVYGGEVISVVATGEEGQFTVLAGHAPMLVLLAEGPIAIRIKDKTLEGRAGRGLLCVEREETVVIVHSFHWANEELDVKRTEDSADEDVLL